MSLYQRVKRILVGKPIATKHAHHERLSVVFGLPVFAADAISSVAYSTEEVLLVLVLGGVAAMSAITPITFALGALLIIIAVSYYQTIHAYPHGGGTYLVSSENIGPWAGLVAGAALLISYVLTVAVSISSGTAAIYSAYPQAKEYAVPIACLAVLVIMIANLRGARESGMLFAIPVYTFISILVLMVGIGFYHGLTTPARPIQPSELSAFEAAAVVPWILFLRGFAASCSALTGTEAIADGVQAFKPPEATNASRTLLAMVVLMLTMSIGMGFAVRHYGIVPIPLESDNYKTVLAQVGSLQFRELPALFYLLQAATTAILILAANTAFADFPRLSSFIARDKFLPRQLMSVGDRLVFQNGIMLLAFIAILLIVLFQADTHLLIQLYAIGVFIAFTFSQAGMAAKWWRESKARAESPLANWRFYVSGTGALITLIVTFVLIISKWPQKSYIILFAIAVMMVIFKKIRKYYDYLAREFEVAPTDTVGKVENKVLLLIPRLHRGTVRAIAYASSLARDCRALHVTLDPQSAAPLKDFWVKNKIDIPLVILESEYRSLVEPVTEYVDRAIAEDPDAMITVIVPQGIPPKWYQTALHSNLATLLKLALSNRRNVVITNVRYFLS